MKTKSLLLVLAIIAVLTASVLVSNEYSKNQQKQKADSQRVAKMQDETLKAVTIERDNYKALAIANETECNKAQDLYALLAPTIKNKNPAPICKTVLQ